MIVFLLTEIGLFDKDSNIKPMSPEEVVGAGTEYLGQRFARLDASIKETIMRDMQVEDAALKPFIETCRLDKWFQSALELSKEDFKKELDEQTDDGEKMRQAEQMLAGIEARIKENELRKADSLLHSQPRHKPRAKINGNFKSSMIIKNH